MTSCNTDHLSRIASHWESLAKSDPLWAILSVPDKKGNKWDINEFLVTGKQEIDSVIDYIDRAFNFKERKNALDFGCGIGRLTLPLANYFDQVVGIDISDTMISLAEELVGRHGVNLKGKIEYTVNKNNFIPFEDKTFDFIYSSIVLQHMRKNIALLYISEFVRVLSKGGFAVFQAPSRCLTTAGETFESPIETPSGKAIIEMNLIPIGSVIDMVYDAGGKVIEIKQDFSATKVFESFKYYVSK
jgi:ubiquinone/menaquinone biosynthesis C-methylase UbiE